MNRQKELKTSSIRINYPVPYHPPWPNAESERKTERTVKKKKNTARKSCFIHSPSLKSGRYAQNYTSRQINRSWPTNARSEKQRKQKQPNVPNPPAGCCWAPRPRQAPSPALKYGIFRKTRSRSPLPILPGYHRPKMERVVRIEVMKETPKPKAPKAQPIPASRLALTDTIHLDIKPMVGRHV